jgi:threonine/homoserine/homoserine lactone efflux protein
VIPLPYLLLTAVLVVTPGAATAVVVRNVLAGGRARGVAAAGGVALANATFALVTTLGIGALLVASPPALVSMRLAGAAVLAALGLHGIVRGARRLLAGAATATSDGIDGATVADAAAGDARAALLEGLLAGLFNPAVALFYLVVVPSFAGRPPGVTARLAALGACHVLMAFACHCAWAWCCGAMRRVLGAGAARHGLEMVTGALLVALAVKVALAA